MKLWQQKPWLYSTEQRSLLLLVNSVFFFHKLHSVALSYNRQFAFKFPAGLNVCPCIIFHNNFRITYCTFPPSSWAGFTAISEIMTYGSIDLLHKILQRLCTSFPLPLWQMYSHLNVESEQIGTSIDLHLLGLTLKPDVYGRCLDKVYY